MIFLTIVLGVPKPTWGHPHCEVSDPPSTAVHTQAATPKFGTYVFGVVNPSTHTVNNRIVTKWTKCYTHRFGMQFQQTKFKHLPKHQSKTGSTRRPMGRICSFAFVGIPSSQLSGAWVKSWIRARYLCKVTFSKVLGCVREAILPTCFMRSSSW